AAMVGTRFALAAKLQEVVPIGGVARPRGQPLPVPPLPQPADPIAAKRRTLKSGGPPSRSYGGALRTNGIWLSGTQLLILSVISVNSSTTFGFPFRSPVPNFLGSM